MSSHIRGRYSAGFRPARGGTYFVAASDAPSHIKDTADYVCDGVADEVEINAALNALPERQAWGNFYITGKVQLSSGNFHITTPIIKTRCSILSGMGPINTSIHASNGGFNDNMIEANTDASYFSLIENLGLWGYSHWYYITAVNKAGKTFTVVDHTGDAYDLDTIDEYTTLRVVGSSNNDGEYTIDSRAAGVITVTTEPTDETADGKVYVGNYTGHGIYWNGTYTKDSKIHNVWVYCIADTGIYVPSWNTELLHCCTEFCGEYGIRGGSELIACHSKRCNVGFWVSGPCRAIGCSSNNNEAWGYYLSGDCPGLIGCRSNSDYLNASASTEQSPKAAIYVNSANAAQIVGCHIEEDAASSALWGLQITATCTDVVVTGNTFLGAHATAGQLRILAPDTNLQCNNYAGGVDAMDTKVIQAINRSNATRSQGEVVIYTYESECQEIPEFTTTTTAGDKMVMGVVADTTIADNATGSIIVEGGGEWDIVKVSGTTAISAGDLLCCHDAAGIAQKAGSGHTAFAIAGEAYNTDDDNGVIKAILIPPRYVP